METGISPLMFPETPTPICGVVPRVICTVLVPEVIPIVPFARTRTTFAADVGVIVAENGLVNAAKVALVTFPAVVDELYADCTTCPGRGVFGPASWTRFGAVT